SLPRLKDRLAGEPPSQERRLAQPAEAETSVNFHLAPRFSRSLSRRRGDVRPEQNLADPLPRRSRSFTASWSHSKAGLRRSCRGLVAAEASLCCKRTTAGRNIRIRRPGAPATPTARRSPPSCQSTRPDSIGGEPNRDRDHDGDRGDRFVQRVAD